MKFQIYCFAICAAVMISTGSRADSPAQLRSDVNEIIEKFESISPQLFLAGTPEARVELLKMQAQALEETEFANLDPVLEQQIQRLRETLEILPTTRHVDPEAEPSPNIPTKNLSLMSLMQTNAGVFPTPAPVNVSWAVEINPPGGSPGGDASDTIGSNGDCKSTEPLSPRARYDWLAGHIAAEAVKDIAGKFCEQGFVAGNTSLACLVTDIAYLIVAGIHENVQLCEGMIDGVTGDANYRRLAHISDDVNALSGGLSQKIKLAFETTSTSVDTARISLLSQIDTTESNLNTAVSLAETNITIRLDSAETLLLESLEQTETSLVEGLDGLTEAVSSVVTSRSDAIDGSVAENLEALEQFREQNMRLHIEKNLGDTSGPIGLFQLPAEYGGFLELVDVIVREQIERKLDADVAIRQAQNQYNRARASFERMNFKDAYQWYRAAYKSANRAG